MRSVNSSVNGKNNLAVPSRFQLRPDVRIRQDHKRATGREGLTSSLLALSFLCFVFSSLWPCSDSRSYAEEVSLHKPQTL